MALLKRVRSFWRHALHRSDMERTLADEVDFHIAHHAEHLVNRGLSESEAIRTARLEFGSREKYKEEARRMLGLAAIDHMSRDFRYACRTFAKHKGFTVATVAILAITIGANAAVYTLVDRLLMRPLPYPQADRLVTIVRHYETAAGTGDSYSVAGATWFAMRDGVPDLDMAMTSGATGVNLTADDQIAYVQQLRVSAGFFRVLGIAPALGREFTSDEDLPSGPSVVVLSHSLWRRTLGADPNVIGRAITLRGEPFVVVGVMPEGFRTSVPVDVWTPLRPSTQGEGGGSNYALVARLRPSARWIDAELRVESVGSVLVREQIHPPADVRLTFRLAPWQQAVTRNVRQPLLVLWAAVLVVLLIGCVNIAGLLLARSSSRAREIATRMAIGGGRGAIVRQLLVESVVLALGGAMAGIGLGYVLARNISAQLQDVMALPTGPDLRVLLIGSAAAIGTSVVFGLFPALHASRVDVRGMLTETGGTAIAGRARRWPMRIIIVSQVALGIVLVVAAGLLIRTFNHLTHLRSGVDTTNVVTGAMSLQDARYRTSERVTTLFAQSLDRIRQLPGVDDAAVALSLPYERALNQSWRFNEDSASQRDSVSMTYVTPDYFRTLRIPVRGGRVFDDRDTGTSPPVLVVNDAFVRQHSHDRDPIGRLLKLGGPTAPPTQIVGVVGDIQQLSTFGNYGPVAALPAVYVPATQFGEGGFALVHTWFQPSWIVRTHGPIPIALSLQRALRDIDPRLTFNRFRTIEDIQSEATTTPRVLAWLLTALAGIALTLCAVGVYGLVANAVVERRRELGIRIALGSRPLQTLKTAAAAGIGLAVCGTAVGLVLSLLVSRVMRQVVFGTALNDPVTMMVAAGIVVVAGCAAALVPAWRTLRMNLTSVLHSP
jgi:predicted permease